jgi:hypothetical protein
MSGYQAFLDSVAQKPLDSLEASLAQSMKKDPASLLERIPSLPRQLAELHVLCSLGAGELERMNLPYEDLWEPVSFATLGYLPHLVKDEWRKRLPPAVDRYLLNMSKSLDKLSKGLDAMNVDYRELGLPVVHVSLPESTSNGERELLLPNPGSFELTLKIWTRYADVRFSNRIALVSVMTLDSILPIAPELPFPW